MLSAGLPTNSPLPPTLKRDFPPRGARPIFLALAAAITILAIVAAPAQAAAQQAYPSPYGTTPSPYAANPYAGQYAQPAPQPGAAQPQYAQPQYADPQYAQPQYAQPQYAQPQAQQPYANQPYSSPASPDEQTAPSQPVQALSAQDLEQLLAPIALYPDALLAQILTAATYPAQVAVADQWLQQMRAQGYGSPDQIAAGANAQTSWDPSIKALTAFPDVLDMLDRNLEWTTALGNAYYNQPQDVMQTVQVLRESAEQDGNLQSTPQEQVTNDQGYVELAPPDPQVVYVPTYDPWAVYGVPIAPYPGFAYTGPLAYFDAGPIEYGLCFALDAFERFPFGWLGWGFDWMGHGVMFGHSSYFTRSASVRDWGLPHGGPRAYRGWNGGGRMRDGSGWGDRQAFNRGGDGRGGGWSNDRSSNQAFNRPGERLNEPSRLSNGNNFNRGFQDNRGAQSTARTAPQQNSGYRPQMTPNRGMSYSSPGYASRPQTFSNPGFNSGYNNRPSTSNPSQAYAVRPGFSYANPYTNYRAPQQNTRAFTPRSSPGNGYSMNRAAPSSGFRSFSNNSAPRGFSSGRQQSWGGGRAPSFSSGGGHQSAPRSFGGGGGHASAPKMSHSSGGGGGRRR